MGKPSKLLERFRNREPRPSSTTFPRLSSLTSKRLSTPESQEESRNRLPQLSTTTLLRPSLSQEQERFPPSNQDRSPRMLHALLSIKFQSPLSKSRPLLERTPVVSADPDSSSVDPRVDSSS